MYETYEERFRRHEATAKARREQADYIAGALLKIQIMGLTYPECMVECVVPQGINPMRWKAMIHHALQNGIPE